MLKKIGRNVAKQSMHIRGKAIDLYFPDVPVAKIRGSAIVRQAGGVGYYPRSGVSGFVHIDSGNVRYWPRPSATQMADIVRDYRKTVGARMTNGYMAGPGRYRLQCFGQESRGHGSDWPPRTSAARMRPPKPPPRPLASPRPGGR